MLPLERSLRNQLDSTIQNARETAETAARSALEHLGVGESSPPPHLSQEQRALRRSLRAHGRQLGDVRHSKNETQEIERLVEEAAYEHWHRMLFARFLTENNLLMYPDPISPVAITLEECDELASDEGARNGWELAARYASLMLPQIFRIDSPIFRLELAPEHQRELEQLLTTLPEEVFLASDSLGWVYQFWQSKKKDEVNASEVKIGARELPAVTQLFTEPYMVSFLLDNALGAWWAGQKLSERDFQNAVSEEELRNKASLPGVSLEYLRFIKEDDGKWRPAAGFFSEWPENLAELKVLDPCCGSGHFLVAALLMLVPIRMELEGMNARDAVDAVIRDNLHGLDIDPRVVEIAAFAVALTAWRYPEAGGFRPLPQLPIACSGLSVGGSKDEWKALAGSDKNLRLAMEWLHDEFKDASVLGSLLNPRKSPASGLAGWDEVELLLEQALSVKSDDDSRESGVVAQGMARAARIMAGKYHWIITNVPYLARGKQSDKLKEYIERHFKEGKNDLATAFLERSLNYCIKTGVVSLVLPQNWLFLTTYKKLREKLLQTDTWHMIARLGAQAFQTPMWDFNVQLLIISKGVKDPAALNAEPIGQIVAGIDASGPRIASEKADLLLDAQIQRIEQRKQLHNPDYSIMISEHPESAGSFLNEFASSNYGSKPGQTDRVIRNHWEISYSLQTKWQLMESTPSYGLHYTGKEKICLTLSEISKQQIVQFGVRSADVWNTYGVIISQMGQMPHSIYMGNIFDNNTSVIRPYNESDLVTLVTYIDSGKYLENVRMLNQKIDVAAHSMVKVPFDIKLWRESSFIHYPNGLPRAYSNDPTQWIFHGHPCASVIWDEEKKWTALAPNRIDSTVLHVAVARLLGYRWPAELDEQMELAEEARILVKTCDELLGHIDNDGIVAIPAVSGEAPAADRLINLLADAYGEEWNPGILAALLDVSDHSGKSLESWLRDKFFTQHCSLFQNRPFIWQIWDGLRDGFSVLVNYHVLDRKNLENLVYNYLGDWIRRQKDDIAHKVDGAIERLAAAENLKKLLELVLEGEQPYDIFVRWKPLEQQPVGWEPDLNDGVRLNIRPFMTVADVGKKGAGVLRDKPNIKWDKDRGKDVESAPWFSLGPKYGGKEGYRINDHHLALAEKRAARNS